MRVTSLKLANVRAIETAEFRFQPGFNLIVGVNGVGKTTVLGALSVCLSAVVKQANELSGRSRVFSISTTSVSGLTPLRSSAGSELVNRNTVTCSTSHARRARRRRRRWACRGNRFTIPRKGRSSSATLRQPCRGTSPVGDLLLCFSRPTEPSPSSAPQERA